MKRFALIIAVFALFLAPQAKSQIVVDLLWPGYYGVPSTYFTYSYGPTGYSYYNGWDVQVIVKAADLIANGAPVGGGKIPAMSLFAYTYNSYNAPIDQMTITLAHTTSTDWQSGPVNMADETVVLTEAPWNVPNISSSNKDWYRFEFDKPFVWNGTSNVVVKMCKQAPSMVYGQTGTYNPYMYVRYGYDTYPPSYATSSYVTRYTYNYSYYGAVGNDWCENYTSAGGLYGPYSTYARPDMRFEVCNEAPLVYDMTVPAIQYLPGTMPVTYSVGRTMGLFDATVTLNLYQPNGTFVKNETFQVPISADMKNGVYQYTVSGVAAGFYRLEAVFTGYDECGNYADHYVNRAVMVLDPGSIPCEVWPGDVNNDGIVNYGDRASLNTYIHDANLSTIWLNGPARFRADLDVNPLGHYAWEVQPSVPWGTPEGCFMDADGNGLVNNFDYIAVKMNWMRTHGLAPKAGTGTPAASGFSMDQNYPNPFNPSTTIRFTLPERSTVRLVVSDMLGKEVATLISGDLEAGAHSAEFDASKLSSGSYIARAVMTGVETGTSFTQTMKMTLGK